MPQQSTPTTKNRLKTILLTLTLFTISAMASAQFAVTNYTLDELNAAPGELTLSPNYLTLLEFPDLVDTVATGRADLIQVEVDDNRILLRPTRGNGKTDLIVKVSGVNALFTISIESENGTPRRYVVDHAPPPAPEPEPEPAPAPTPEPEEPQNSSNVNVNNLPMQTEGHGYNPIDDSVQPATKPPFEFTYNATTNSSGRLTIHYTLVNNSGNPIANDSARLTLHDDQGKVEYNLVRMNSTGSPNRLQPGTSEHGVITADRNLYGRARLEWPIVEQGPGKTYVISELMININHD